MRCAPRQRGEVAIDVERADLASRPETGDRLRRPGRAPRRPPRRSALSRRCSTANRPPARADSRRRTRRCTSDQRGPKTRTMRISPVSTREPYPTRQRSSTGFAQSPPRAARGPTRRRLVVDLLQRPSRSRSRPPSSAPCARPSRSSPSLDWLRQRRAAAPSSPSWRRQRGGDVVGEDAARRTSLFEGPPEQRVRSARACPPGRHAPPGRRSPSPMRLAAPASSSIRRPRRERRRGAADFAASLAFVALRVEQDGEPPRELSQPEVIQRRVDRSRGGRAWTCPAVFTSRSRFTPSFASPFSRVTIVRVVRAARRELLEELQQRPCLRGDRRRRALEHDRLREEVALEEVEAELERRSSNSSRVSTFSASRVTSARFGAGERELAQRGPTGIEGRSTFTIDDEGQQPLARVVERSNRPARS